MKFLICTIGKRIPRFYQEVPLVSQLKFLMSQSLWLLEMCLSFVPQTQLSCCWLPELLYNGNLYNSSHGGICSKMFKSFRFSSARVHLCLTNSIVPLLDRLFSVLVWGIWRFCKCLIGMLGSICRSHACKQLEFCLPSCECKRASNAAGETLESSKTELFNPTGTISRRSKLILFLSGICLSNWRASSCLNPLMWCSLTFNNSSPSLMPAWNADDPGSTTSTNIPWIGCKIHN